MILTQERHYLKKNIDIIERAISVHQSAIDSGNLCDEELQYRQDDIEELIVDLEEYSTYEWLINPDEIREVVDEAFEEVKATIINKYKMRLMDKVSQHFDKLTEGV